jgi:hypothetical protein
MKQKEAKDSCNSACLHQRISSGGASQRRSESLGRKRDKGEKGHADGESMRKKLEPSKMESGELTNERPVRTSMDEVLLKIHVGTLTRMDRRFVERPVRKSMDEVLLNIHVGTLTRMDRRFC